MLPILLKQGEKKIRDYRHYKYPLIRATTIVIKILKKLEKSENCHDLKIAMQR